MYANIYKKLIENILFKNFFFLKKPMALIRNSWKSRGATYTEYGITMHCVGIDQIGQNHILHYLDNGSANLCFAYQKEIFFVPAIMILKGLVDMPDYEIYRCLMRHRETNSFMEGCAKYMLRQLQEADIFTRSDVLNYIGSRFRVKLMLPDWYTDIECANYLFKYSLFTHLDENIDKFNLLMYIIRKFLVRNFNQNYIILIVSCLENCIHWYIKMVASQRILIRQ